MSTGGAAAAKTLEAVRSPACNCAVLCDDVVQSHVGGKHTLVGIVNVIVVPAVPARVGPLMSYVRLYNQTDPSHITLELEDAATGDSVFVLPIPLLEQEHPLNVSTVIARLGPFGIEKAGLYLFGAKFNGVFIAASPILIQTVDAAADEGRG